MDNKKKDKKTVSIKGGEAQLLKVFSKDYLFEIPSFQRPYSWTTEESGILFDDLYEFYNNEPEEENYFLGSIVLIKEENDPLSLVIDGQQRLTTLSILFSAIAYSLNDPKMKESCLSYIREEGKLAEDIPPQYRLTLREKESEFFRTNVQENRFDLMKQINLLGLTEPKRHLVENSLILLERLSIIENDNDLFAFFKFLIQRCYIVVVSTPSIESAFRVFSVMNNRGLDLLATDILKAKIIGQIEDLEKQQEYTKKWEDNEELLGRNNFNELIGHIRTLEMKSKAKKSILDEFTANILSKYNGENGSIALIDTVFDPYSVAYLKLTKADYDLSETPETINETLRWLNRLDNSDWIPPAMLFYKKYKDNPEYLEQFLTKLERLAAYLRITSVDVTHRIERYALISKDIEEGTDGNFGANIELSDKEKKELIDNLNDNIYQMTSNKAFYILFRLDSFLSTGEAKYDLAVKSIEHVLPQNPNKDSNWCKKWNADQREEWTDKLGNLVLLNRRKNSAAGNKEFEEKKETYFQVNGSTPFTLTSSVLKEKEWTPEIVQKRQNEFIELFKKKWDLKIDNDE